MISQPKYIVIFTSVLVLILISLFGTLILRNDFANSLWDITLNIALGFLVSWGIFYFQYRASGTRKLVNKTKQATKEIIEAMESDKIYIGDLRNRYRYHLGIPITNLYGLSKNYYPIFFADFDDVERRKNDSQENILKAYKGLADRWSWYNEFVRPLYEKLSTYDFWQDGDLKFLINLCEEIENTVALLDAKIEITSILVSLEIFPLSQITKNTRVTTIKTNDENLIAQYAKLKQAWLDWCKRCRVDL